MEHCLRLCVCEDGVVDKLINIKMDMPVEHLRNEEIKKM